MQQALRWHKQEFGADLWKTGSLKLTASQFEWLEKGVLKPIRSSAKPLLIRV